MVIAMKSQGCMEIQSEVPSTWFQQSRVGCNPYLGTIPYLVIWGTQRLSTSTQGSQTGGNMEDFINKK